MLNHLGTQRRVAGTYQQHAISFAAGRAGVVVACVLHFTFSAGFHLSHAEDRQQVLFTTSHAGLGTMALQITAARAHLLHDPLYLWTLEAIGRIKPSHLRA